MDISRKALVSFLSRNRGFVILFLILATITFSTSYYGSTDIGDYADSAKFFAGEYAAKIRNTHSYMFGLLHAPLVELFHGFLVFKVINLGVIILLILSVHHITRSRHAAWLMALCPLVWYMAPWISPILFASFFILWGFYFMERYQSEKYLKYLAFSAILFGAGLMFWDTVFYFIAAIALAYLIDKKVYLSIFFVVFVLVGLAPRIIFDQIMFNFAFYTVMKTLLGGMTSVFLGGIYSSAKARGFDFLGLFLVLLVCPLYYWILYKKIGASKNLIRPIIFLSISLLFILSNPQIRYVMALAPVMIVLLARQLNEKQYNVQRIIFIALSVILVAPYVIQITNGIDNQVQGADLYYIADKRFDITLNKGFFVDSLREDLDSLAKDHPRERFLVGPLPDDYQILADVYWGTNIEEFVSLQDYDLYMQNKTVIFEKTFAPVPNFDDRRKIWLTGGISANFRGNESYESISRLISLQKNLTYPGFVLEKSYPSFTVFKRE